MIMGVQISKVAYYLPEKVLTNEELSMQFPDWTPERIYDKIGVNTRHIVGANETALDLAVKASRKVLENENVSTIDFVILCTQSPDYFLPTSACILHDKIGLKEQAGAFDINLGCSAYIYALSVAKGLIFANVAKKVLLVTAETYSKHLDNNDKGNRTIFGDAASASIIELSENNKIFDFVLGTDGSNFDKLIVPNGGFKNKISSENHQDNFLQMNGPEIFNFTIQKVPITVKQILEINNMLIDDIDFFLFHQANKYILDYLRKKIKIPQDKFFLDLSDTGNTVSSTIPIGLSKLTQNNRLKKGDKVLLVGFGVGLSWGATIIEI